MKSNIIKILTTLILLVSCQSSKSADVEIPANVIKQSIFINILTDCYLAEGASGINIKNVAGEKMDSAYLFNPLKKYNISKVKFDSSITFYSQHPVLLKKINDVVFEKLSNIAANGNLDTLHTLSK